MAHLPGSEISTKMTFVTNFGQRKKTVSIKTPLQLGILFAL